MGRRDMIQGRLGGGARVPEMPEGYYSSGPNPNLRRFVDEHATPYDPATDDYHVPPFDQPITTTKATAIYNMHTYWSKKPHDAIQQYIRHYTKPGDIVLDPFCGSGSTALAALMEGRAAIAIDLSPAATFITKNYCTPVDPDALQEAFEELERQVKPEIDWLYETRCDRCGGRATTGYTVYSQTYRCPRCLEVVPLFDCVEIEGRTKAGKPKKIRVCPHCHARGHEEEVSTRSERLGAIPVLVSYLCEEGCKPQRGERRHNDPDRRKRRYFEEYDLSKIAEIEGRDIPHWFPTVRMMNVPLTQQRWGNLWRQYHRGIAAVDDLYTKRNLWALATLFEGIWAGSNVTAALTFALTSLVLKASKMMAHNSDGIGRVQKGTYYIPAISHDIHVWSFLEDTIGDFKRGYNEIKRIEGQRLMISTSDARSIELPDSCVDLIFTDPPYGGNVQYGELNFVWEAWLQFRPDWHAGEVIVNDVRGVSESDWQRMLTETMHECYRLLKPGRWISLCYHDTSEGTWQIVQDLMAEVGFIAEDVDRALYIETKTKTTNQYFGTKVTKRDLVINFRKPRSGELGAVTIDGSEDASTFQEKAQAILRETLEVHPGSTADRLYDVLVSRMVRKGEFERHDFDALLRTVAEPAEEPVMKNLFEPADPNLFGTHVRVRWYLRETADRADAAESAREAAAAARLEAFMGRYLEERSWETGVHYSDLFEQYLPVRDKPRRQLIDWLPEFFYRTEEGTWRPPASEEERLVKEELRATGALRRIRRYARALLEGAPPADRDRPTNPSTAADWLRTCYRAGLYAEGRAIYEQGGIDWASLGEEQQLDVEEQYALCVRRSG